MVAFRTATTESYRPTEQVTRWTALLADEVLSALWTFIDGVGREQSLPLQELAHGRLIRWWRRASTKPIGELTVSRRTEPGADVRQRVAAH